MEKILKPWVFSIIGSVLILSSTIISSLLVLNIQNDIDKYNSDVRNIENRLDKSIRASFEANLQYDLSTLLQTMIKVNLPISTEIHEAYRKVFVADLHIILMDLHTANDLKTDFSKLQILRDRAIEGDSIAISSMFDKTLKLTETAGEYRADLIMEIAELNSKMDTLQLRSNKYIFIAAFIQVLGLVILLLKELPKDLYSRKNKDEST